MREREKWVTGHDIEWINIWNKKSQTAEKQWRREKSIAGDAFASWQTQHSSSRSLPLTLFLSLSFTPWASLCQMSVRPITVTTITSSIYPELSSEPNQFQFARARTKCKLKSKWVEKVWTGEWERSIVCVCVCDCYETNSTVWINKIRYLFINKFKLKWNCYRVQWFIESTVSSFSLSFSHRFISVSEAYA